MGLRDVLSKMKLVEIVPEETTAPPPAMPPVPSGGGALGKPPGGMKDIDELLRSIPKAPPIDESKLPAPIEPAAAGPEGEGGMEIPDFPDIYKAAGVTDPAHGYSAYKVLEIFASPGFATLDARARAAALTGFLNMNPSGPVPVHEIVQDAVRRDQALDRFEEFLRNKLAQRAEQIDKENAQLQAEIDAVTRRNREKMEANRIALETEQAKLTRWQITKRAEERKLFDAVNPFVEENPVTTADASRTPTPSPAPAAPTPEQPEE